VKRPEHVFATIALVAGLLLAFAMPPGAAPDETRHLSRVYAMSEGIFRVPGTKPPRVMIPKSIPDLYRAANGTEWPKPPPARTISEMASFLDQPLDPSLRVGIANAGTYPPTVYLPHLLGVAPGRWLELAPAALVYLGRVTSLLAWIALTALAIRVAPARKWTLAMLSLTPMSVASAASISSDPMTNAAALLFAVIVLRSICADGPLARAETRWLYGGALLLAMVKPGYWPLALATLAIPRVRVGGHARRFALAAGVAATAALPSFVWLIVAQGNAPAPPAEGADPVAQLGFVLGHPLAFVGIFASTLVLTLPVYWKTFVGELGPLIVKLPPFVYALWAIALTGVIIADGPSPPALAREGRAWLAVAFAATIVAVFTMAYLGWNPVGERVIRGVQGRYWAPAVPMLVFALPASDHSLPERWRWPLLGVAAVSLISALGAVWGVYYRS
jgi:uncharacterized membrane protein